MPDYAAEPLSPGQLLYIAPEIVLTLWGLLVLLVDVGLLRGKRSDARRTTLGALAIVGALVAFGVMFVGFEVDVEPTIFYGTLAGDPMSWTFKGVIGLLLAMVVGLSMAWDFTEHWGAYFALLIWAAVGMMILIAAEELLILLLALEMMTICLYLASAFEKGRRRSPEAGMKYFVYGSVSSALFLFGLSLLFGLTGTTYLDGIRKVLLDRSEGIAAGLEGDVIGATAVLLILVGFGFKVAAVPFHQWAPDTYEGAPAPVSAWIASGSKVASFIALMKVFLYALGPMAGGVGEAATGGWVVVVALIAAVTMTFGNLAALAQRNLKRLLAYSSIAHAGYILVGVLAVAVTIRRDPSDVAGSVLFYLVVYGVTTVAAFAAAAWLAMDKGRDDIADLDGLGYESPGLAVCLVVLMLSLIGLPPLAGFFAKLNMFLEVVRTDSAARAMMIGLVALALLNTVVSAFYYVRVLRAMFLRRADRTPAPAPRAVAVPLVVGAVVSVGFGFAPAVLLEPMQSAAGSMLAISMPAPPYEPDSADQAADRQRTEGRSAAIDPEPVGPRLARTPGPSRRASALDRPGR